MTHRQNQHGDAKRGQVAPEYQAWLGMIKRCHGPRRPDSHYYRARGIVVCESWRESYLNFLADMGRKPTPQHTLDRINNDGGYEPGNCRWATRLVQSRNRRGLRLITFEGRTMPVSEAAGIVGLDKDVVYDRLKLGWSEQEALTTPVLPSFGGVGAERFSRARQRK